MPFNNDIFCFNFFSFALRLERCVSTPAPLPSPLIGGLPGSSILIGQQAAALWLAQLKAQLALSQVYNTTAVSRRTATSPYVPTAAPSPTASAINLLNLLKIANTMSQPMYNPYASGNHRANQGQYGLSSIPVERDPQQTCSHLGPGSILCSSGGSSGTSANTGQMIPSALPQTYRPETYRPETYRPEKSGATHDDDIQRNVDMHISRAREEMSHHTRNQDAHSSIAQQDGMLSGMTSHVMSSASAGHVRHPDVASTSSSLGWLSDVKRNIDNLAKPYSPAGSFASSSDVGFKFSSERERDDMSFSRSGGCDYSGSAKPLTHPEPVKPRYTSETAADILLHFGLEKEDLEQLISYPEDQLTPANLPYILHQIRIYKSKGDTCAVTSGAGRSEQDISKRSEAFPSTICQPSKVIEYGHTGKYTGGLVEETVGSGSRPSSGVRLDTSDGSSSAIETLLNKTGIVKPSDLGFSSDQMKSLPHHSSVTLPSHIPNKFSHTQTKHTSVEHHTSVTQPKKDTDSRVPGTIKPPLKQLDAGPQKNIKAQPPPSALVRGVHPSRPGLVVIGSNDDRGTQELTKTPQGSAACVKHLKTQQIQQQKTPLPPPPPTQLKKKPLPLMELMCQPSVKPVAPASSLLHPQEPQLPTVDLHNVHMMEQPSNRCVPMSKGLPSLSMMNDYTASMPRIFPHTCVLCNKECFDKKDWLLHQKSNVHFESCKLLRLQYPKWNGEVNNVSRSAGRDAQPSRSVPQKTGKQSQQRIQYGRRSRSPVSHYYHDGSGRREKFSSQTQSPHSSTSLQSSGVPSRSYERRSPPRRSNDRQAPRGRSYERDSSPARGHKWQSPHRRSSDRRSPRGRSEDRYCSPRRSREGLMSPNRSRDRRSPREGSYERYSPPRSSHERRALPESSSSSAQRLAKKLLETTGVQSLSDPSKLEAVVKTLAPALLAELAKLKSSSSSSKAEAGGKRSSASTLSSSASTAKKKPSTVLTSKAKPNMRKSAAISSFKAGKSSPPTMVKLHGVSSALSYSEVVAAMSHYGKTKSVVLFRSSKEAVVCFQREEDAMKLKSMKTIRVKGLGVGVGSETDHKGARAHPSKSSAKTNKAPSARSAKQVTHLTHDKQPGSWENCKEGMLGKSMTRPVSNPHPKPQTSKTTTSANKKAAPGPVKSVTKKTFPAKPSTSLKTTGKTALKDRASATKAKVVVTKRKMSSFQRIVKPSAGKLVARPTVKKVNLKGTTAKPAVSTPTVPKMQTNVDSDQKKLQSLTNASVMQKDDKDPEVTAKTGSMSVSKRNEPAGASEAEKTANDPTRNLAEAGSTSVSKQKEPAGAPGAENIQRAKDPARNLAEAGSTSVSKQQEPAGAPEAENIQRAKDPARNLAEAGSTSVSKQQEPAGAPEAENIQRAKDPARNLAEAGSTSVSKQNEHAGGAPEAEKTIKDPTSKLAEAGSTSVSKQQEPAGAPEAENIQRAKDPARNLAEAGSTSVSKQNEHAGGAPEAEKTIKDPTSKLAEVGSTSIFKQTEPAGHEAGAPETEKAVKDTTDILAEVGSTSVAKQNEDAGGAPEAEKTIKDPTSKLAEVGSTSIFKQTEPAGHEAGAPETEKAVKDTTDILAEVGSTSVAKQNECVGHETGAPKAEKLMEETPKNPAGYLTKAEPGTPTKTASVASKTITKESTPGRENTKPENPETEDSLVVEDVIQAVDAVNAAVVNPEQLAGPDRVDLDIKDPEPMETETVAERKEEKPMTLKPAPENSPDMCSESHMPPNGVELDVVGPPTLSMSTAVLPQSTKTCEPAGTSSPSSKIPTCPEKLVEAPPQTPQPDCSTQGLDTKMEASPIQQECAGSPAEAAVEVKLTDEKMKTYLLQKVKTEVEASSIGETPKTVRSDSAMSKKDTKNEQTAVALTKPPRMDTKIEQTAVAPNKPPKTDTETKETAVAPTKPPKTDTKTKETAVAHAKAPATDTKTKQTTVAHAKAPATDTKTKQTTVAHAKAPATDTKTKQTTVAHAKVPATDTKTKQTTVVHAKPLGATCLFGELTETELLQKLPKLWQICRKYFVWPSLIKRKRKFDFKVVAITNLPQYCDGCYTENDIINLLRPFGFKHANDKLFVIPQVCMAYAMMPSMSHVSAMFPIFNKNSLKLGNCTPVVNALSQSIKMSHPVLFYESLMNRIGFQVNNSGKRLIYIQNISTSETKHLKEALKKIGGLTRFLPLLNKVFIEFNSSLDADRLGVWYSLLNKAPGYEIHRLAIPYSTSKSKTHFS
ncbi:serine/arginine repetitive matrix protein 2-like isoform X2 [Thalassophryne amazonica]|uniref:serine/arginine repetitive matrix protein 2-like isoform X2 n=1 Tax=Thalassophryne amazonica TaxID=390379 RepID=UPI001472566C|nr:serine/arginine repetitive matrix protein 2-like isoform X2 [Thalassophryne amazonica]